MSCLTMLLCYGASADIRIHATGQLIYIIIEEVLYRNNRKLNCKLDNGSIHIPHYRIHRA